jgi:hypothetical protein
MERRLKELDTDLPGRARLILGISFAESELLFHGVKSKKQLSIDLAAYANRGFIIDGERHLKSNIG